MEHNAQTGDGSPSQKGREALERGDVDSALTYYRQVHDPDALDEGDARDMLIEARASLSRKHLYEALEHFEEALLMGTDVQRRQALEGIAEVGKLKINIAGLHDQLSAKLEHAGLFPMEEYGMALISRLENVALMTKAAAQRVPAHMAKGSKVTRVPQHLTELVLPVPAEKCVAFTDEEDVRYIVELCKEVRRLAEEARNIPSPPLSVEPGAESDSEQT